MAWSFFPCQIRVRIGVRYQSKHEYTSVIPGLVAIIAWAGFWSVLMFGGLSLIKKLRIDRETEFKGNDMIKHGESAYPRDAWVEMQYSMKNAPPNASNPDNAALPPNMQVRFLS